MAETQMVTINYKTDYGEAPPSVEIVATQPLTSEHLPTLTASGYTFTGWVHINDKGHQSSLTERTIISTDWIIVGSTSNYVVFTAKWVKNSGSNSGGNSEELQELLEEITEALKDYEDGKAEGYEEGKADGVIEGVETGKQEMVDAWWKVITQNGNRKEWAYAFANQTLKNELFRPPCTMVASGSASSMFYNSLVDVPIDAQALEEELGYPILDTSGATNLSYFNYTGVFSTLGIIDIGKVTNSSNLHYAFRTFASINYLRSIKKLIVSANTAFNSNMFQNDFALVHCPFEGTIGKTGLDVSPCTALDKESLTSVVNCLSTTTSGLSVTVSKTAVNKAFETSSGANNGSTSAEWTALVGTKSNWTISLV